MKTKKIGLALIGLMCAGTLAACSAKSEEVISMKGDTITADDIYQNIKTDSTVQQKITNLLLNKVADKAYGDKVDSKEVDKAFETTKKQYGDNFESALKQSGLTVDSYKESLKTNAAFEKMLEAHIEIKDADLKEIWATYHPEVETQLISVADKKEADSLLEKANKGDDFGKLAKEKSTLASAKDNGTVKFDSSDSTIPDEVKKAAYELKDGAISKVLEVSSYDSNYQETKAYYIVKMVKNQEKGNDMKPFKKQLTKLATDAKKSDSAFQVEVIGKEFKKANVKVKDEDISGILSQFMPEEKTSSTNSSGKETKSSKEKETKSSDSKEKKTDSSEKETKSTDSSK